MCDTFVALPHATASGSLLFAKNSDRDSNEAQELVLIEGKTHPAGSQVRCTYIEVPQVKKTYSILLSKPFWIWGAELGANENGVVIGNEAVFTRYTDNKKPGLIGMDFLRLALERSKNAYEALEVITSLLGEYGQSGNCRFAHAFYYDNSYLIADRKEAWVLETAGRQWAAEKVKDIRSISNILTIESKWDVASEDLVDEAVKRGWCKKREDFKFRKCYSDLIFTTFGAGKSRQTCSTDMLRGKLGSLEILDMIKILRNHREDGNPRWNPGNAILGADICMHAGWGPVRGSQTAGSMVAELNDSRDSFWMTGTAAPCLSIFKPIWLDSGLPDWEKFPEGKFDPSTVWWRGEELHRLVMANYAERAPIIKGDRDRLEAALQEESAKHAHSSAARRREFTLKVFETADQSTQQWLDTIQAGNTKISTPFYYRSFRKTVDKQADFPN